MSGYFGGGVEDSVQVNYYQQKPCHLVNISLGGITTTLGQAIEGAGGGTPFVNVKAFGATGNGTTDDTAAILTAIAAVQTPGGLVFFPSGKYLLNSSLAAVVPANVALTLEGTGPGSSVLYFGGATDGLSFELQNSGSSWGSVSLHSLGVIRGPTSPVMANTGINIYTDPAVASMASPPISFREIYIAGSEPGVTQWLNSIVINGVSACTFDDVRMLGANSTATDQGDVLLTINGPSLEKFAVNTSMVNCVLQGGSAGINVTNYVQGLAIVNSTIVGQYDSVRWLSSSGFFAEELAVSNCSLNAGHRGVYISNVNSSSIATTTILHFNTGVSAGFAGIEIDNSFLCSVVGNNVVGAHTGTENGIILNNCSNLQNNIIGNTTTNLVNTGIALQGTTSGAIVVGNALNGGGTSISQATFGNTLYANSWNGTALQLTLYQPEAFSAIATGQPRWFVGNDGSTESGANTGNNFEIVGAADNGSLLGACFTINRASGYASFNPYGGSDLHVYFNGAAGMNRLAAFQTSGANRWFLGANSTAESGGNAGSDLALISVSDAGSIIGTPIIVTRANGNTTFSAATSAVNSNVSGAFFVANTKVVGAQITGWGTSTGGARGAITAGSATLAQVAAALAQLLTDLESHGLIAT